MNALVVINSDNKKLGGTATTYAHGDSCPDSCAFKGQGCYGEHGPMSWTIKKLEGGTPEQIARAEAEGIRNIKKPLRLHSYGDCKTPEAARILAEACKRNNNVWTYTHAWREIERADWGNIKVFASCENITDAKAAIARGYLPALVIDEHKTDKVFSVDGIEFIPCPEQTGRSESCMTCRLCWTEKHGKGIAFAVHGMQKNKALKAIRSSA